MLSFFTTTLSLVAALAPTVLGAPNIALRDVKTFAGKVKPKGYIVTLKEGVSKDELLENLESSVTAVFNRTSNGFAGVLDDNDLNSVRANPKSIAQDGIVSVTTTQTNAPWGLARISQRAALGSSDISALIYRYNYDPSGGAGVDVYVVDTVINRATATLTEMAMVPMSLVLSVEPNMASPRSFLLLVFYTPVADLPQSVHLIAVKVLNDSETSGKPSIVSLSLGGSASTTFDNGIIAVIKSSQQGTVNNTNVSGTSPAHVAAAITVGASTIADARASFSNYGSVVDIFAPGQYVTSSWIGGTTRTNNISGTSMATPHISGLVAYLIGLNGNQSPAAISTLIKSLGISGVLSNIHK
ncbi:uncharacterized protein ARMOST_20122 [Armillaria ostoyae]|uniref:Peptidase S8/S53 domain-containing protein n=1 Tax=Armillaria ostoyae TaxID=47428 RepID=A0A284S6K4_ARMOS|nr:uncharacterized protein ARMOST_20122 [Armillaria ostoyae]